MQDWGFQMTGLFVLVGVLLVATVFGLWFRSRDGRIRQEPFKVVNDSKPANVQTADVAHHGGEVLGSAKLGHELGSRATLVQFSSSFCQPCKATKLILADLSEKIPGLKHVEIDAEANLDLVRNLGIRRTPTVLILDQSGAIMKRAVGQPRKSDVVAAVAEVV
jgi:thiol-disulfide isomerase/thioredoxin